MNRSILPTLKAGLSRLHLFQHRGVPSTEADATWPRTERRITERRSTQRRFNERRRYISDFRHRELRLRAAAQVTGTGVYDFDFATGTNYWSPELKAMAGLPEDSGKINLEQMTRVVHPEDGERFVQKLEASLDPGGDGHLEDEFRLVRPDGALRWVRVRGRTFFAGEGSERRVLGVSGLVSDITEQKRAEEALRASEEKYRTLFANMTEAFALGEPVFDAQGKPVDYRFLEANDAFYAQSGISPGNLGRPVKDYVPVVEQSWVDYYAGVATTGQAIRFENYNARTRRLYNVYAFSPSPGRFAILFRDITKQRSLEEELRKFKFLSDHSIDGQYLADSKGRIYYANRQLCESLGYTEEELLRLHVEDIAPNSTTALFWELVERIKEGSMLPFESSRRRKDGSTFPVEVSTSGLELKDDWLVLAVSRDITERKRAEKALKDSERRLTVALEASASAVWEMDVAAGTVRGENLLFTGLGYAPGELTTRAQWKALIHRDDRAAASQQLEEVIQGRRDRCRVELRFRAKDGSWRWMLSHAAAAERDEDGRALWLVGTHTDTTERKEMEEASRQDRSRLQSILDNAPVLISIKDLEGRMVLANRAYYELLKVPPPGQFIGHTVFEIFPEEVAKRLWADDHRALETNGPIHSEERARHRDGSWHTYLLVHFPIKDIETGKARNSGLIGIDISDRKVAEGQIQALNAELENRVRERTAQLQESNEALLQSNTELKHFAHATAHDLQTPLRSIAGFSQLVQKEVQGRGNEQVDEWSAAVVENTRRLQILIQEVLCYTRLEVQGLPFQMTDVKSLFDEVVASLSVLIGETGAEITSGPLPILAVDRTQIAQVFQNLIENGIKYNRSMPPRVAISSELQEDAWVFSVADNGIGIDPKHHDRIFELFQRLHAYHQIPGTGIGLALCRRIVERHGGHIWVDSRPGKGSTFYFSLPAERREAGIGM